VTYRPTARQRLHNYIPEKTYFWYCDYNDNWSVWLSRTVSVGYIGDRWVVGGSDIRSEAPSRDTLTRDSIQNTSAGGEHLK
jgi:hypothetical protein